MEHSVQSPLDPDNISPSRSRWFTLRMLLEGVAVGVAYGVFFRLVMSHIAGPNSGSTAIMTVAFLFFGPMMIGYLVVNRAGAHGPVAVWQWIVGPWASVLLVCATTMLLYVEGAICVIFALPIALIGASIGGIIAGIFSRQSPNISTGTTACIAILPLLLATAETRLTAPIQTRTVASEIRIHSSAAKVWRNIERVPAISPTELQTTWAQRIGFPRPVEATLSYEGIGGVRHASFEHGLLFIETVTDWQTEHRLAFSIKANTADIPPTTLDEHVTIGGPYFDVLNGEYRIEPLSNGDVLLHLTSHQRLSTDFNGYAGMWSDAVMQSLQTSILQVIKHRCEKA